ncbi:hypothetical protein L202_00027 [Cryptococcus amylolentus CBS 6039]|uniref:Uncharacterized protein n=1 Tax=Cryptococcus amylolentus CBS 6039 TaxID=1295533 RepID=A0A1E3I614_9TREE|nr:hypothetical protein L202_00027 [Cryptococcus amylolentus CBS 6039]ODN83992.1 hypothetical protein L202_00027 [Cryptococcus amylolentus CBS 6039]
MSKPTSALPSRKGVPPTGTPQPKPTRPLTKDLLESFHPSKRFSNIDNTNPPSDFSGGPTEHHITSLAFDASGMKLICGGDDDQVFLYDALKGKMTKKLYSKKYGVDHVRFTHKSENIIHASTRRDDAIRYQSLHDNRYISYFRGHTSTVRSISMSPTDDTFVSAGDDGTVRLWDLRAAACRGLVNDIGGSSIAAMDNTGMVFAVACTSAQTIMMYATKTMDALPFLHLPLIDIALESISTPPPIPIFTSLSFSNNGHYLLVGTSSDVHYVLDAMELTPLRRLVGHKGLERDEKGNKTVEPRRGISGAEVGWTGNSEFVVSGSATGEVLVWDLRPVDGAEKLNRNDHMGGSWDAPGREAPDWTRIRIPDVVPTVVLNNKSDTPGPSRAVAFNPRYNLMAVGGRDLSLWIPPKDDEARLAAEGY